MDPWSDNSGVGSSPATYSYAVNGGMTSTKARSAAARFTHSLTHSPFVPLAVPRTRTTLGDRSFAVVGPHVWNSLPATIRQITNYRQFRQRWGAVVVICLQRGADLHMAQLMPLPLTVSCYSKIQIGFTFLVPAHLGSPGQRAVKRV